jgi:hypothetical protein
MELAFVTYKSCTNGAKILTLSKQKINLIKKDLLAKRNQVGWFVETVAATPVARQSVNSEGPTWSREAEKQRSREAEKLRSRGAEKQRSREAEKQRSREAEEQRSRGAEKQRSREAEKQRSREAEK